MTDAQISRQITPGIVTQNLILNLKFVIRAKGLIQNKRTSYI